VVDHQALDCLLTLGVRSSNDYPFTRRKSVGLDHNGRLVRSKLATLKKLKRSTWRIRDPVVSSWNVVTGHEVFSKDFARLKSGGGSVWTDDGQASLLKEINESRGEWGLWSNEGEINLL
jgi:hypothetical protein